MGVALGGGGMHIHIGHCSIPEIVPLLEKLKYYFTAILWWYGHEKWEEIKQDEWNSAADSECT